MSAAMDIVDELTITSTHDALTLDVTDEDGKVIASVSMPHAEWSAWVMGRCGK